MLFFKDQITLEINDILLYNVNKATYLIMFRSMK